MSHFLGTPSHSRVWALKHSEFLDPAKTLRKRLLSGATVDIYIGPEKRHWSLHKKLLCHHSSYLETEFQGHEVPRKENVPSHNTLNLPDDDPRGFELLVKWLYQGCLDDVSHMNEEERYEYAVACHKLYQLCEKFDMIHVKNLAIDEYRRNLHAAQLVPDVEEIDEIYRASPRGSPFRKLMTKIAARQIMDPEVDKDAESYRVCFDHNPDFAVDMINAIRYGSGGILFDDPTEEEDCLQWHDHRDGSCCHLKDRPKVKAMVNLKGGKMNEKGSKANTAPRKLRRPPLVELSEQPTPPRKLDLRSAQPPGTPRRAKKMTGKVEADRLGFARKNSTTKKVNGQNAQTETLLVSHPSDQSTANGLLVRRPHMSLRAKKVTIRSQPELASFVNGGTALSTISPKKANGFHTASDKTSSVSSGTRASSIVNGMVGRFNGIVELQNSSSQSNLAEKGEKLGRRPPPPKLKRKSPG